MKPAATDGGRGAMATYCLACDDVVAVVDASDPSTWPSTGAITYGTDLTNPAGPISGNELSTAEYNELTARHGVD